MWQVELRSETTGERQVIRARTLINAAGPWVADVSGAVIRANTPATVRLVQGSHIVVRRLFEHEACYIFQNGDGRIFFAIPYERDFTLIGTTDQDFKGDPTGIKASEAEIEYLCAGISGYMRKPVTRDMVIWTYSGVRPLYDDGSEKAQEATRDYVLKLDAPSDSAALLSVFGGKITTYRRLAESALATLAPHLPKAPGKAPGWTGQAPLPGGDFAIDGFEAQCRAAASRYPFVPPDTLRRLLRAYGTRIDVLLENAKNWADLGPVFGADLTEAELRYLASAEWARTAEDVVWRRTKLGLRMSAEEIATVDEAMQRIGHAQMAAA
jgi:glycerol-3-phosphate dehydrogenase